MATMMRLDESSLKTPEPYHIPGYCGYCPQFKYKIKDTFGKTTHDLLTEPSISRSTRPVLLQPENEYIERKRGEAESQYLVSSRGRSFGEQKYGSVMVPGYTGYIPKGQHYFGDRYAVYTGDAIAHMEKDQRMHTKYRKQLRQLVHGQEIECPVSNQTKYKLPLRAVAEEAKTYFPKFGIQHSLSPYTYADDDPKKYMLSGYTGFVPNLRATFGMGFPDVTKKAMCEFTKISNDIKATEKAPIIINRPLKKPVDTIPLYVEDCGMVPHYTGHVPGEKFRYGRTYGFSTVNAVPKMKQRITHRISSF